MATIGDRSVSDSSVERRPMIHIALTQLRKQDILWMPESLELLDWTQGDQMTTSTGENARIRVSLTAGELEIEGTEAFVSQYADSIESVLDRLRAEGPSAPPQTAQSPVTGGSTSPMASPAPGDQPFGEVLHSLSSKAGTDQILLAGYYVGKNATDGTFSTIDANKLLIEQGVKLSNASQSLKNNVAAKRAFKVGSRYKVAKLGIDYLKTLVPAI
jgi:hypothetical protein